jgi:hypothetical protein
LQTAFRETLPIGVNLGENPLPRNRERDKVHLAFRAANAAPPIGNILYVNGCDSKISPPPAIRSPLRNHRIGSARTVVIPTMPSFQAHGTRV